MDRTQCWSSVCLLLASCLTISPTVGQLCPDPLTLPHPPSNSCYSPLDQGPCPAGSWLVEEPDQDPAQLHCQVEQCGQEMILYNDQCYDMFDPAACPRQGERLYLASSGRGECYCDEGWGRGQDGSCYQEFTRGPCEENQIVMLGSGDLDSHPDCLAVRAGIHHHCVFPFRDGQMLFTACAEGGRGGSLIVGMDDQVERGRYAVRKTPCL